jgi:two-component system NtrC family sensor kinase
MREDADSPAKTQQLNAQTQRLASLGFMVASVCHEVSNPLAAVSSMLQILQSKRGVTP